MIASHESWRLPPQIVSLGHDAVHLWCAQLDQPVGRLQQLANLLSPDEQARAELLSEERDRMHFIAARGLLRTILSWYTRIQPHQLQFWSGPHGKPELVQSVRTAPLRFSLAYSAGLALYGLTLWRHIGVDLEYVRPVPAFEQLGRSFLSEQEWEVFAALPSSQQQEAWYHGWTRKEAWIKAVGLAWPLKQLTVSLIPGEPARLLSIAGEAQAALNWSMRDVIPRAGYMGTLVVEGAAWTLTCWQWPEEQAHSQELGPPKDLRYG